ncbi:MAG: hypothetical protein Ct9H90mP27_6670 [Gammaproteobacteria bacterium]|nr:MAG: hypothetical protein Ct9H90mP27_6670 [Gammaproteobacteria bacterium]
MTKKEPLKGLTTGREFKPTISFLRSGKRESLLLWRLAQGMAVKAGEV